MLYFLVSKIVFRNVDLVASNNEETVNAQMFDYSLRFIKVMPFLVCLYNLIYYVPLHVFIKSFSENNYHLATKFHLVLRS